ncbi:MAG: hypothetical protein WC823_01805 [Parcubacteria group bacterium]|jgi:hypothetical protein
MKQKIQTIFFLLLCLLLISIIPEKTLAASDWGLEGVAWYTFPTQTDGAVPLYRFWSDQKQGHFYTASEEEKNHVIASYPSNVWSYEGIAYYVNTAQALGTVPVYRFWSDQKQGHFYTASEEEKNHVIASYPSNVWHYEGIAYYVNTTQVSGTVPVFRFWSDKKQHHFYTASEAERDILIQGSTGPQIAVGLWYYSKEDIQADSFEIDANKTYNIKDKDNVILAQIDGATKTKVTYDADGNLKVYNSIADKLINTAVTFDAADGNNSTLVFNVHRPNSSFDQYRDKITVRYYRGANIIAGTSDTVTQIWVINTLPLEHYVWGMGETTGTGPAEHTKVMTTIFRTYGQWYIDYATKYAPYGFKIRSDTGSQLYYGYEWEIAHPNIKTNAGVTQGVIATYGSETALTPYSSWSNGRTRSFEERWGSKDYPWCKSVSDPYGKHPTKDTATLEAEGNHMVGLIANGSLKLAGSDYNWDYQRIMKYYFSGINLGAQY